MAMTKECDYAEALTVQIVEALHEQGLCQPWLSGVIQGPVQRMLIEIQHRLYQDILANGIDLARQLYPKGERRP